MVKSKCQSVYHRPDMKVAPFKFCPDCGEIINDKLRPKADCARTHTLRKTKGNKYCPDCGEKLGK